jgi:SAM-dependent methyltransferase
MYCGSCGFVTYSPRPEESDIASKYHYLKQIEPDIGGQTGHSEYDKRLDYERAARVYSRTTKYFKEEKLNILDYGGGNGKLMLPYLEAGHNCHIVDYSDNQIAGVMKVGNDVHDIVADKPFDTIVLSHVLEHVSNPVELLFTLREHLAPEGLIYAEVPHQIWAGIRIDPDPVTHTNFFTLNSFRTLFNMTGFHVLADEEAVSNYRSIVFEALWIVARAEDGLEKRISRADTEEFIFPSRAYSLRRILHTFIVPTLRRTILG